MSIITLPTRELVGLLTDTVLTAGTDPDSPVLATALLDCDHGEVAVPVSANGTGPLADTEPSDLLVATSTDGQSMAGQAHTACAGRLHKPVLISTEDAQKLIKVFKTFKSLLGVGGERTTHQTQLEIVGDALVVSEDPRQVPGGVSVTVPTLDTGDYPQTVPVFMQPDVAAPVVVDGAPVEPSYGTGMSFGHLEVTGKVGKRRKAPVALYRHHQRRGIVVEIGSMYRAVFMPAKLNEGEGQHLEPQVPVFTPRLAVSSKSASLVAV